MTTGAASACPQCGAPLRFGGGASLAAVCAYCRSAVLRAGANLEAAGKVPDLVATDTRLSIGAAGRVQGRTFVVLGRLQLSQGDAVWNEWYASFGDGAWGWLAESQGKLYVTRPMAGISGLPRLRALHAGLELELPGAGRAVVDEVNEARLISFEGELPVRPKPGESWHYADCTTESEGFLTLDYGSGGEPVLYAGRAVSYAEAGIADLAPAPAAGDEPALALACPGCGGPIALKRPEAKAFACPSCRSLLDVSRGGLRVLCVLAPQGAPNKEGGFAASSGLEGRSKPPIPLGAKGTLRGEALEVLGFLVRSIAVDAERYPWQELLLHGSGGYRWLSVYGGHWLFLRPIAGAKVQEIAGRTARCDGRNFKHFQGGQARYDEIQGEFYWQIRAGEKVRSDDYVAPPFLLSAERTEKEVSWSRGEWTSGEEIWKAFGLPGKAPRPVGVGAAQPNPHSARAGPAWKVAGVALLALLVLALVLSVRAPRREVVVLDAPLTPGQVTLSEPFELIGGPQAVEIDAEAVVSQAWVGLDVALIQDETGESEAVGFELSHFAGVEDGEAWSEGSRRGSAVLGSVGDGRYLLRVEPQVQRGRGYVPASARLRVVRGIFLATPLLAAIALVCAWPLLLVVRAVAFEHRRWEESDHPWGGEGSSTSDSGGDDE